MSERRETTYGPEDLRDWDPDEALGAAGSYPYTRGPYPSMYGGRLWTMRQYAGFGDADATNMRFRSLLDAGQTGLSVAFDLPTSTAREGPALRPARPACCRVDATEPG